jgi:hypothetical protein
MRKDYVRILEDAVTEATEHLEFLQGKHDRHKANSQTPSPFEEPLKDAKESLKAAQVKLQRGRDLVDAGMQREIEELMQSVSPQAIEDALQPVRRLMLDAAMLMIKAVAVRIQVEQSFRDRAGVASHKESQILDAPDRYVNFAKLPGFSQFRTTALEPADVISEIERIASNEDSASPIRDLVKRDGNRVTVAGLPARDMLSMAGLA